MRAEQCAAREQAAAGEHALLQKVAAVEAGGLGAVADRAVGVEDIEVGKFGQGTLLVVDWGQRTTIDPAMPGCSVQT